MTKSSVRILAAKGPARRSGNGDAACRGVTPKLAQNKNRVKAGMHIPIRSFQLPASIGTLIMQNALHNRIGLGSGLANQAIKVDQVECGCDVIAEISIRRLILSEVLFESCPICGRKCHAKGGVEQREKADRVPREFCGP
jgi:hypothetical protein